MVKEDFLRELDLKAIENTLLGLPEEIAQKARQVDNMKRKKQEVEEEMKKLELAVRDEVAAEVNERGRPVYSNETRREAEARRRLENDESYLAMKDTLEALKADLSEQEIELRLLEMRFSACRHRARLAAAQLAFMAES